MEARNVVSVGSQGFQNLGADTRHDHHVDDDVGRIRNLNAANATVGKRNAAKSC